MASIKITMNDVNRTCTQGVSAHEPEPIVTVDTDVLHDIVTTLLSVDVDQRSAREKREDAEKLFALGMAMQEYRRCGNINPL